VLTTLRVVLDAEFNSASNGITFGWGRRAKIGGSGRSTGKTGVFPVTLLTFACGLVLSILKVVLDAELNSASNGITFRGVVKEKGGV
jgi:hypothetical protein